MTIGRWGVEVTFASRSGAVDGDFVLSGDRFVAVLRGGPALAPHLDLLLPSDEPLDAVVDEALRHTRPHPDGVAIVRDRYDVVDYLVRGDLVVLLDHTDGRFEHLTGRRAGSATALRRAALLTPGATAPADRGRSWREVLDLADHLGPVRLIARARAGAGPHPDAAVAVCRFRR
ncbi:hypothetical protein [Actinosynnema sp. NPDC020468]|uniref:hypothetical protein n=1 Tax=Actinosynnema sp. NPDC020468 TaxID=3154488 RepID=UPI0033C6A008